MPWDFIWMMFALKIPLAALIWLVWWAIRQEPEPVPTANEDDGGLRTGPRQPHHPRPPLPRRPRRGPHGGREGRAPASPPRVRTVKARARTLDH